MLHIFDHAAHHVDPLIPLYQLEQSQQALENKYPQSIKIINWNLRVYWNTLSCCKLYDYREHRWLDYRGNPTTEHQCDHNWRLNDKPNDPKSSSDLATAIPL
jgi:omega-6 fatty acid desaturase (delta-12 desaturase)